MSLLFTLVYGNLTVALFDERMGGRKSEAYIVFNVISSQHILRMFGSHKTP
jgi:hypothetical protein